MAHVIRRRHLSRRTFLRGAGAALALPWLDAMLPALATPPDAPRRGVFVFVPNGKKMDEWTPKGRGRTFRLPHLLEPLDAFKSDLDVFSGLALDGARAHGDGPGDHARAAAAFLTCTHPKKTGGADLEAGRSIDQEVAARVGKETRFPSLELGLERGRRAGACDSGYSCAYSNNVAWRSASTPVAKETDPRAVFERLFGDPEAAESEAEASTRRRRRRSVLDVVLEDARKLGRRLGRVDRAKLDDYLTSVRELERRLAQEPGSGEEVTVPDALRGGGRGSGFSDRLRLMYDLVVLALRTDSTRVVTLMVGNAGSNRSYGFLSVPDGHHTLSHHGGKKDKLDAIRKINRFHVEQLAYFLGRLKESEDDGGSLLDHSLVLYGSGISDGDRHQHHDLPVLVAGRAGGMKTGRHVVSRRDTPLANLHVTLARRLGVQLERFGDSTGTIAGI